MAKRGTAKKVATKTPSKRKAPKAQRVAAARVKWDKHIHKAWGGTGLWVHKAAVAVQDAAGTAMVFSAPIPVVGVILEGSEIAVYAAASAVKGLVRTSAENHAVKAAGGTAKDRAGLARTFGNIAKSTLPEKGFYSSIFGTAVQKVLPANMSKGSSITKKLAGFLLG